jgi:hypothetical protein
VTGVPLFVADWTVDGMTAERLVEFRRLLQDAADRVSSRGTRVRYMRCTHVPEQSRCICLLEADDIEAVRSVNQIAQAPFAQIGLAVEFYQANESDTDEP